LSAEKNNTFFRCSSDDSCRDHYLVYGISFG